MSYVEAAPPHRRWFSRGAQGASSPVLPLTADLWRAHVDRRLLAAAPRLPLTQARDARGKQHIGA